MKLNNKTLDIKTLVDLNDTEYHEYRYINYFDIHVKTEASLGGCFHLYNPLNKCHYVFYDSIVSVVEAEEEEPLAKLNIIVRLNPGVYHKRDYSHTLRDYIWDIIETVSFWLGFSVFSVVKLLSMISQKLYIYMKSF